MHSTREHPAPWECVASSGGGVKEFEAALMPWLHEMERFAWQEFVLAVERRVSAENGPCLREKGREDRVLWTCTGPVKIRRRRYCYTDGREQKSFVAFDMRVGLAPREHLTPSMRCRLARLAAIAPSYEAARMSLETVLGESPSARTIWKCAQAEGERLREQDREKRRSVFEDGELPGEDVGPKDFVGIEADSTMVHAWRSSGENHEVFVGIAYDGKDEVSKNRRRLANKVAAGGVYGARDFGRDFFIAAQSAHNVFDAKAMLYGSDGAACLENLRQEHFPAAPHQLDWRHAFESVRRAYGWDLIEDAKKVIGLIAEGDRDGFERQTIFDRLRLAERRSKIDEMRSYLLPRWEWLFASRELSRTHPEIKLPTHLRGTGGIERNVGTIVGHRMKWRGMGWTRRGAANILRVRLKALGLQN